VAKPSTKVLHAKENHKFVCSVVIRVVELRQEVYCSKLDFFKFLVIDRYDLYFFSHVARKKMRV
jgi:hypothetical protein